MGVVALTGLKKFCELGIALYICDTELRMLKRKVMSSRLEWMPRKTLVKNKNQRLELNSKVLA